MPFLFDDDTDTLPRPLRPAPAALALSSGVGDGEANASHDVDALDESMRHADPAYRPADYPAPQRYIHGPLVDGVRDFQKRHDLPANGRVRPGDDTERAINNRLLAKPPGAGLLHAPYAPIRGEVGASRTNDSADVVNVKRGLAALGHGAEHPRDTPNDWIDDKFLGSIRDFQRANGLTQDGWLAPGGETETAVRGKLAALATRLAPQWRAYAERAKRAGFAPKGETSDTADGGFGNTLAGDSGGSRTETPPPATERQEDEVPARAVPAAVPFAIPFVAPPLGKFFGALFGMGAGAAAATAVDEGWGAGPRGPGKERRRASSVPGVRSRHFMPNPGHRPEAVVPIAPPDGMDWRQFSNNAFARNAPGMVLEHRGNAATQAYDAELARQTMANAAVIAKQMNCKVLHIGGGEYLENEDGHRKGDPRKQNRLRPRDENGKLIEGQTFGHSFPDTEYLAWQTKRRLFINSYTPKSDGNPIKWEHMSGQRLRQNAIPGDIVLLVPKLGPNRALDPVKFQNVITPLLMEICTQYVPVKGQSGVQYYVVPDLRSP